MAVGKNKRLSKGGKRGLKKKVADCMVRKDWYDVVVPQIFKNRQACKTIVNKTVGTKISADNLKGRIFECNLGDLATDQAIDFRKVKFQVQEIKGRSCITNFYGMDLTTDKLKSLFKKWCTTIEATVDCKTNDGYSLRVFLIAFTKKATNQIKKNCYAKASQVRRIRAKMTEHTLATAKSNDLQQFVNKLGLETIGQDVKRACNHIYPLRDVFVRKVKVKKQPNFDVAKLMEVHGDIPMSREEIGQDLDEE